MSEYIYLYRGQRPNASPEDMQQMMQKWIEWLGKLGKDGHLKAPGHPLKQTGKVVRDHSKSITDGPYAEKELVGGYSIVEATSLDHAVELAAGCPILLIPDGSVEVRPIMQM